ncbi:MAG: toll/interleukin-1 receptor domain-containing protein [Rhizobiaceae bacterium]
MDDNSKIGAQAWIFVSHASQDLPVVRLVRNYLESKGAAPLLFHLRSLMEPQAFWPVIEAELKARNFFLYCDSPAAAASDWVRKERAAVEKLAAERAIRIGMVRVTQDSAIGELDTAQRDALDAFLRKQRVFVSSSSHDRERSDPFITALTGTGFAVFEAAATAFGDLNDFDAEIAEAAANGWIVCFWSQNSSKSPFVIDEISRAIELNGDVAVVRLDGTPVDPSLAEAVMYDASDGDVNHPARFTATLLTAR